MKTVFITGMAVLLSASLKGQTDMDALRYTNKKFGSTARSMSIGGAVGSLGADVSSSSVNPAGLAQFRNGEFSFSLGINNIANTGTYLGNSVTDNAYNMNIPNLGFTFFNNLATDNHKSWKSSVFSFNVARVADFNRTINFSGINTNSSLMDYFAERANGYTINQIRATDDDFTNGFTSKTTMAWEAYLFDSSGNRTYVPNANPLLHDINQKNLLEQKGGMTEYNMSLAGNYNNRLYLGATISYTRVRFEEYRRHSEVNDPRVTGNYSMDNFTYGESLKTKGGGLSGRFGIIARPGEFLRLGLGLQTPQIIRLNDEYDFSINSTLESGENFNYRSKDGLYEYTLLTPGRFNISATALAGKHGFISIDVEQVNYSAMRLRSTDHNNALEIANDNIRLKYTDAWNFRTGGELAVNEYRFRAGYANYGSPFVDDLNDNGKSEFITAGFGVREKNWSLDLALVHNRMSDVYQPYVLNDSSKPAVFAENRMTSNYFVITLSSKF